MNTPPNKLFYEFADFRLDPEKQRLLQGSDPLPLTPKAVETLRVLIERRGQVVEREELMNAVWPEVAVEDGNLTVTVSMLRKVLAERSNDKFIETFPKRGYKFIGEVREVTEAASAILVEKQTVGRVVIDEQVSLSRPRLFATSRQRVATAVMAVVGIALVAGGFVYSSRSSRARGESPVVKSMAVLPFKVINSTDNNHQGLGLADVLITRLSNIKEINVRPTSSVFAFENSQESSTAIGQKLLVDAVLEGSILLLNDRVRVTTRLIRVGDQSPIWAGEFEKAAGNEMELQDEIALQVVNALALHLRGTESKALTKRFTQNAEAYELYVKGRYHWNKRSYGSLAEAEHLFRSAIEKDPNFALAYVGLADSLIFYAPSTELNSALRKAIELDPNLAEAWASQGFMLGIHLWRWKEAEESFKKSITLNPGYATAHHWYATLLEIQGKHEEAKAELRRALEIDPLSYNFLADLGQVYYFNREYQTAEEFCKKSLAINPDFSFAHNYLGYIYMQTGRYELAIEEYVKSSNLQEQSNRDSSKVEASRAQTAEEYLALYREGGIKKYLEWMIDFSNSNASSLNNPNSPYHTAIFHTRLGHKEEALSDLERAYKSRAFMMAWVKAEPAFDSLRSDSRFKEILQKMNLPAD